MKIASKILFKLNYYIFLLKYYFKYFYFKSFSKFPAIYTFDETIQLIYGRQLSISRFGDGEIRIISGSSIEFQDHNSILAKRLIEVICTNKAGIMIGLPDVFADLSVLKMAPQYFWKKHLSEYFNLWIKLTDSGKSYGNAFMSRPYIIYKTTTDAKNKFDTIKCLWNNRDLVIVEGEKTRLGVGNDLFYNARSIERILCPNKNAFKFYNDILTEITKLSKSKLFLLSLGPTATVLAYDLFNLGFQALDIGHIDLEYEWYLRGTDKVIKLENKFVNEVENGDPSNDFHDVVYQSQIYHVIPNDFS